jgi:hypothetical protein
VVRFFLLGGKGLPDLHPQLLPVDHVLQATTAMPRRVGRPRKAFLRDPDRFLMALALAYRALGMSLRGGCEAAVATMEGWPVGINRNRGRHGRGMNLLDWRYELKRRPGAAATIDGRARGLRQKIKNCRGDAAAVRWLGLMHLAFLAAWQVKNMESEILQLAQAAGETEYATDKILKIRKLATDNFSPQIGISKRALT